MNRLSVTGCIALWMMSLAMGAAEPADAPPTKSGEPPTAVAQLLRRDLMADSTQEVVMLTVTYPPGGSSPPHRHDAQVFVYVLAGTLNMQVKGQPAVTLHPGETFYESPSDIHVVSANASDKLPAKFLVFMIKDKNRSASRPAAP